MIDKKNCITIEGKAKNWEEAIRLCGKALQQHGLVEERFSDACIIREKEYPTGLPSSIPVAIPHSMSDGINESCICFLRLEEPVEFKRMDDGDQSIETRIIFNLAIKEPSEHIQFLQKLMGFLMDENEIKTCLEKDINEISEYLSLYLKRGMEDGK